MRRLRAVDALLLLLVVAWATAWTYGILRRYFDFDEFEHLYAIWRVGSGDRPFYDFFEVHPPFVWYALYPGLPVFNLFVLPLFPLRFLSAAGNVVLLIALGKNVSLSFSRLRPAADFSWRAFVVAAAVLAGQMCVIWYLIEFRTDAWPNALMLLAIYWYRRQTVRPFRSAFLLAFIAGLTLLCSPKLIAFFGLFSLFNVVASDERLARATGLGAGALAAALAGCLFLRAAGVSPVLVYQLCIKYHSILSAKGGFGHGLAAAIFGQPQLVALLFASLAAWLLFARGRMRESSFELSVIAFLVLQPTIVAFGYKQYYAPWFLLGLIFVPYLELGLRRAPGPHRLLVAVGILCAGFTILGDLRTFAASNQTAPVVAFNDWARLHVPPNATVAGGLESIPIYRRSPLYQLVDSYRPSGYPTEAALALMGLAWMAERVSPVGLDRDLETGRPVLVVPSRLLTRPQSDAIDRYRARHRAELRAVPSPAGTVELRL